MPIHHPAVPSSKMPSTFPDSIVVGVTEKGISLEPNEVEVLLEGNVGVPLRPALKRRGDSGSMFARFAPVPDGNWRVRALRRNATGLVVSTVRKGPTVSRGDYVDVKLTPITVLYVIIDRPQDAKSQWDNIAGLTKAALAFDSSLVVRPIIIDDLAGLRASDLKKQYGPFAIFGAGSFSEWFHYQSDPSWKGLLDSYMAIIRDTDIPMLAVCGSHHLVAAAFNGWTALAHMNNPDPTNQDPIKRSNPGTPLPIPADFLANPPGLPYFIRPDPERWGEVGTYPIQLAPGAPSNDKVVAAARKEANPIMASMHHSDMVVTTFGGTSGFTLLFTEDTTRDPDFDPNLMEQRQVDYAHRCHVQGLKFNSTTRLLYSVQFHPEISKFMEARNDDNGFGNRLLQAFFNAAHDWWLR